MVKIDPTIWAELQKLQGHISFLEQGCQTPVLGLDHVIYVHSSVYVEMSECSESCKLL